MFSFVMLRLLAIALLSSLVFAKNAPMRDVPTGGCQSYHAFDHRGSGR